MSRFFVGKEAINGDTVTITGDDVSHIKKVLRLKPGEIIVACDGNGIEYTANIEQIETQQVTAKIIDARESLTEAPIEVVLFQGIPKSDKMEFVIQKSIELGVTRIVPIITERTIVKFDSKKDTENKRIRWQRISFEAAKQSNRGIIPVVDVPVEFKEAIKSSSNFDMCFIPYEKERVNKLKKLISNTKALRKIAIFIGPEGGFAEEEIEKAQELNIIPVTLGPRILRTETAGITVISILMYELGDVG